jgi:hypothetical protein
MKHRYVETLGVTATGGVLVRAQYLTNGMFDPQVAVGGHQPMYFDQLAALYNHFTVVKSKITVSFSPSSLFSAVPAWIFGAYIEDDTTTTPGTDVQALCEQSTCHYTHITSEQPTKSVTVHWDAVKAFGRNPESDPNLQGTGSSDPTEQQIYNLFFQPQAGVTSAGVCLITVEYDAIWQELKNLASS